MFYGCSIKRVYSLVHPSFFNVNICDNRRLFLEEQSTNRLRKSTSRRVSKFSRTDLFSSVELSDERKAREFLLSALDATADAPFARIRDSSNQSKLADRSILHSHETSILPRNRLVESSARAAINVGDVLRSASRTVFLRVVCQEINSSYPRASENRSLLCRVNELLCKCRYFVFAASSDASRILKTAICFCRYIYMFLSRHSRRITYTKCFM